MSYFETRPAVVDVDADVELVARVSSSDERGLVVHLTVLERAPSSNGPLTFDVSATVWTQFVRAVAAELRDWT